MSRFRMIVICLALLLEGMSTSGINVQLGALRADLGFGEDVLQLVAGAFLIAYAGLLPIAGALADHLDRRRVFLVGIALFGVGCVLCALAFDATGIVIGRIVQGAGAALSAPAALALITQGLPEGAARNRAVATYGAMGAVGFSLGLVLPGAAVTAFGWRWSFLISVPAVVLVLAATRGIRSSVRDVRSRPDITGAVLLTAALMIGVHMIGALSTAHPLLLCFEAVLLIIAVGVLVGRRGVSDIPREVMTSRHFQASAIALGMLFAGVVGSMYALSLAAAGSGLTALGTALIIVPQPLLFSLTAGIGSRLVTRHGPARIFGVGAAAFCVSLVWLGLTAATMPVWASVLPAMAGVGLSLGLCFPAASVGAVDATPERHRATAAGLLTTAQNLGGAIGIAVLTALGTIVIELPDTGPAMLVSAAFAFGGVLVAGVLVRVASAAPAKSARSVETA